MRLIAESCTKTLQDKVAGATAGGTAFTGSTAVVRQPLTPYPAVLATTSKGPCNWPSWLVAKVGKDTFTEPNPLVLVLHKVLKEM